MIKVIKKECEILKNKSRFIQEINSGQLKIQNLPKEEIMKRMKDANFLTQCQIDGILEKGEIKPLG